MKEIIQNLIKVLGDKIIYYVGNGGFDICLAAYNYRCINECGNNYIFDLHKQKDLIEIIRKGMTAEMISKVINDGNCFVDVNNEYIFPLSKKDVIHNIKADAYHIAESVIKCPYILEYKEIYHRLVIKQCEEY